MEVDSWVEEQLAQGRSPQEVRADLADAGWPTEEIDRIMDRVSVPASPGFAPPSRDSTPTPGGSFIMIRIDRRTLEYMLILSLSAVIGFGIAWFLLQLLL